MQTDGQFEPVRGKLALVKIGIKTVSKGDHVPYIEQLNRNIN